MIFNICYPPTNPGNLIHIICVDQSVLWLGRAEDFEFRNGLLYFYFLCEIWITNHAVQWFYKVVICIRMGAANTDGSDATVNKFGFKCTYLKCIAWETEVRYLDSRYILFYKYGYSTWTAMLPCNMKCCISTNIFQIILIKSCFAQCEYFRKWTSGKHRYHRVRICTKTSYIIIIIWNKWLADNLLEEKKIQPNANSSTYIDILYLFVEEK